MANRINDIRVNDRIRFNNTQGIVLKVEEQNQRCWVRFHPEDRAKCYEAWVKESHLKVIERPATIEQEHDNS